MIKETSLIEKYYFKFVVILLGKSGINIILN